jgi:hypothetical protein
MPRRRPIRISRTALQAIAVVILVVAVTVVVVTIAPRFVGSSTSVVGGVLTVGAVVAYPPSTFWGVGAHAVKILNSSLGAQLNRTPINLYRFGGGGDTANQTTGVSYSSNGVASGSGSSADPQFVKFCQWQHCHSIMTVPGEINDPGAAAVTVSYVETTLGYHPDYWSIGNEPQLWLHYNIPWTQWRATDASTPTPQEYALLVQRYIAAMKTVDATIHVIGIQSTSGGREAAGWITPLVALDGPNLSAIAYHSYPGGFAAPGGSVATFLDAARTNGYPSDYRTTQGIVAGACPSCHIPVFVDEFNGAVPGYYTQFVQSYPDVPLIAAAVAIGLQLNTSQFAFFDLQATEGLDAYGLVDEAGHARPSYDLYSVFFQNLSTNAIENTTILGGPGGAVAVVGENATTTSLLIANENATDSLRLSLNGSGFPTSGSGTAWSWDPSTSFPAWGPLPGGSIPSSWLVPPEGILLIDVGH